MRAEWIQQAQLFAMELLQGTAEFAQQMQMVAMLVVREGMPEGNGGKEPPALTDEEIPWAHIYHKAREIMGMQDGEFWSTSPRKFFALLEEALVFRGIKKAPEQVHYMDEIF